MSNYNNIPPNIGGVAPTLMKGGQRTMLSAIVTTVVIFMLITWAYARLNSTKLFQGYVGTAISDPDELEKTTQKATHNLLLQAIGVAIGAGAIVFITPRLIASTQWLAIPFFGLAVAGFINLFLWWLRDGSEAKEMIPFALLALMFSMIMGSPASVVASLLAKIPFLARLIAASSSLAFWAFIGFMVVSALLFKAKQEDDPRRAKKHKIWGIILAVIIGLIFALSLFGALKATSWSPSSISTSMTGVKTEASENTKHWWTQFWAAITGSKNTDEPADEPADEPEQPVTQPETYYNWHFRHFEVLQDDDDKNDDYFGTSILDAVILDKIAKGELTLRDTNGKDPEQLMGLITVDEYLTKLVDFAADDPALGAALMGAYDVENHTRHLGDFSSEMKEHPDAWMRLINGQKDGWVKDQPTYWKYLAAFAAALEDADDVYLKYYKAGLTDQMYMDAHTVDGTPDVIVMESATESGVVLVIENRIKGTATKATVLIRDDCGGQPCNIAEAMGVTPAPNPNKAPSNGGKQAGGNPPGGNSAGGNPPGGSSAGGNPNGDGQSAGGNPEEDPGWSPKDLDRGSQGLPVNNITGVDPDTNDGLGAQYSAVQDPTGSTFIDTYQEYTQRIQDNLYDPNNGGTRTGKDPNTPTYTPPTYMPTDNNGDKGNGGAPINTPTPVTPGATYNTPDSTGKTETIDVTTEERGTDWGGLPDA